MSAPIPNPNRRYPNCYFTYADWAKVLEQYGNKCAKCGATENLSVDHIEPRCGDYGPDPDVITNIQPLCKTCNTKKGNRKPDGTTWVKTETSWYKAALERKAEARRRAQAYEEKLAEEKRKKQEEQEAKKRERERCLRHSVLLLDCAAALGLSEKETIMQAVTYLATRKDVRDALAKQDAAKEGE